jgi:hypothetical protein
MGGLTHGNSICDMLAASEMKEQYELTCLGTTTPAFSQA